MLVLITYDVNTENPAGKKRLRKVAKLCERYGIRVQNSVFEVLLDAAQLETLKAGLSAAIDTEHDSVRCQTGRKNHPAPERPSQRHGRHGAVRCSAGVCEPGL